VSGREHFTDPHTRNALPEGEDVDVVAIAEQIGWRRVVRERLHDLLRRPAGGGMLSHVEVEDPPPMVSEHDGDEEDAQVGQIADMVRQERAPSLVQRG
jgi:hypothetical protein